MKSLKNFYVPVTGLSVRSCDGLPEPATHNTNPNQTTVKTQSPAFPTVCPKCFTPLIWRGKDLICPGQDCIAKLSKRIAYFYSENGMDLKGIGIKMIEELLEESNKSYRILKDKPWALLDPITYMIYDELLDVFGMSVLNNLMDSLQAIKARKTILHFISGLGKNSLGYKTALKVFHYIMFDKTFKGVSQIGINNFTDAFIIASDAQAEMQNFSFGLIPKPAMFIYAITGTLSQARNDFIEYLKSKSWEYSNTVTQATNYLIIGDSPGKTKIATAKKYNIKMINEAELIERISND